MSQNIFLFYGDDTFRLQKKIDHWKNAFAEKHSGDTNISIMDGGKFNLKEIVNTCETLPFLAEKRLIFLYDFLKNAKSDDQKQIAKYLENISKDCILVFIEEEQSPDKRSSLYKKITKLGRTEIFSRLEGPTLTHWVQEHIEQNNGKISHKNADFLARHIGSDLWQLNNEIEKLITYRADKEIREEDILLLTKANIKTTIFRLTDYLGQKNARLSIDTLKTLTESGEDIFYIFHMIIRQFRMLIQIKSLLEKGKNQKEITRELKQHPYVVMTTMRQCRNFAMENLKNIYRRLLEIDIASKTGKIRTTGKDFREFSLALETFILDCC